jgi:hypothetical protein
MKDLRFLRFFMLDGLDYVQIASIQILTPALRGPFSLSTLNAASRFAVA